MTTAFAPPGRPRHPATRRWAAAGAATLILSFAFVRAEAAAAPSHPSAEEQQFVYELNRVRWDPASAGLDAATALPTPPLAVNPLLLAAAAARSAEMAAYDYFAHRSPVTGLWPNQVVRDFGYPLPDSWPGDANSVESLHQGQPTAAGAIASLLQSPDHRTHLLGQGWFDAHREAGVGFAPYQRIWTLLTAHDGSGRVFLTGVAYRDTNRNCRLDPGEGLPGVVVTAGASSTITNAAGGWSLAVPPGAYVVSASGGAFAGTATIAVRVGEYNVTVDFRSGRPRALALAYETCAGRAPTMLGTSGRDLIQGTPGDDVIHALGGDDTIYGGGGDDLICGGSGDDVLVGGPGGDDLRGGAGLDRCSAEDAQRTCE